MASSLNQPSTNLRKPPRILSWLVGIIVVLFALGPLVVSLYTDWQWFGEVDFRGVYTTAIITRIILFFAFGIVAGLVTFLISWLTWKNRPSDVSMADVNSPVYQYRDSIAATMRKFLYGAPLIIALAAGFMGQAYWRTVLLFLNGGDFGREDAEFGMDLGFYAFNLPLLNILVSSLSVLLIISFVLSLVGYYILGGIRVGSQAAGVKGSVSKPARIQLAVIAGLWMLVQVASYFLDRYTILFNQHDIFAGASFTNLHADLPAKIILIVVSALVAVAFFMAIVIKDLRIPGLAVVLMLVTSIAVGTAWPMLMEQFSVQPNRALKEAQSIERNIEATRFAYNIDETNVEYETNWGAEEVSDDDVAADENTISNLRLLDPDILAPTFTQQQQLRNFYGFPDVLSMDRYEIDGEQRDFVVAARELDPNALRENQRSWINRHTVYTHGNGFVAAQANTINEAAESAGSTRGGFPVYTVSDLQTLASRAEDEDAEELGIKVDQPRVYYGPVIASAQDGLDYAIVGGTGNDVEYDTDSSSYTYSGEGGVGIGNWFTRAIYAAKYQEMNFLLSDRVGAESKILYDRDPRARVEKVAPWLTTDSHTYPAVVDGKIKWIVDGYTTLDAMPYSTEMSLSQATRDALNPDGTEQRLINDRIGYIRNSVKATVDAYDGTVELYEFDAEDPVLDAWRGVFPDTVKDESEISDELRAHFRYPEDIFKVQRNLLARYHVDDPGVYFSNDAFWSVPLDPTQPESQELPQPPYYVMAADPENPDKSSFQMVTPFRGLEREFLSAHMTVTSDPENYGDITVRVLPTNTQTQGPRQAQDAMMSSDQVARDRGLWERTNELYNGNLLTLPVGGGEILYLEPIYAERKDQDSAFPKLLRVLVSYKGRIGYAPTIGEALEQVGIDSQAAQDIDLVDGDEDTSRGSSDDADAADTAEAGASASSDKDADSDRDSADRSGPTPPASGQGVDAINDALRDLEKARDGSFEEYGRALDRLDRAVENYQSQN